MGILAVSAAQAVARLAHGHEVEGKLLEPAIQQLAESFVESACAFGCGMVRRRKGRRLEPSDMTEYLDRNWYVHHFAVTAPGAVIAIMRS